MNASLGSGRSQEVIGVGARAEHNAGLRWTSYSELEDESFGMLAPNPAKHVGDLADRRVGLHRFEDQRDEVVLPPRCGLDFLERRAMLGVVAARPHRPQAL